MLRFFIKLLITLWPFAKDAVFKGRTIREVLNANRQFTILFGILILITTTLLLSLSALSETKTQLAITHREVERLKKVHTVLPATGSEPDKEKVVGSEPADCVVIHYDKQRIIDLLRDGA